MNTTLKTISAVCILSIAMAALESAVVVYLRALYYPDGFSVAFQLINKDILQVELLRELATLVMLSAVGYIAGKTFNERMAYFLLSFAVWDIFYYGWLKVLINWPASVFEWDILFLIPFTWLGPVWAPLVCSLTMMALAFVLLLSHKRILPVVWAFLITGSIFILYTFMEDYGWLIISNGFLYDYANLLRNPDFLQLVSEYIPDAYNWSLFLLGEILLLTGICCHYRRSVDREELVFGKPQERRKLIQRLGKLPG